VLLNGTNPLLLLRELRELGSCARADTGAMPALSEIDPERCYVAWDMVSTTSAAADAIRDVFIFVEDECELKIEPGCPIRTQRLPAAAG
jgi:two-component system, chemotaxis family, sensor kinase CheA